MVEEGGETKDVSSVGEGGKFYIPLSTFLERGVVVVVVTVVGRRLERSSECVWLFRG